MRMPPLAADPLGALDQYHFEYHPWNAHWIGPATADLPAAGVWAFCTEVDLAESQMIRLHVTADQRYQLYLDGRRVGRGPERGDLRHWMYESYQFDLAAGRHVLAALVWWHDPDGPTPPPAAQITHRPALLVFCEEVAALSTTADRWRVKPLPAYRFAFARPSNFYFAVGSRVEFDAAAHDWNALTGDGDGWQVPTKRMPASLAASVSQSPPQWLLRPAMLPAMIEEPHVDFVVRHVDAPPSMATEAVPIEARAKLLTEVAAWQSLLQRKSDVTVPPNTRRRVVIDLTRYACAYTALQVDAGLGATVRLRWSEALHAFDPAAGKLLRDAIAKGDRGEIEGKHFVGYGDTLIADGHARTFEPLWWGAGRYLELAIETADQPLIVRGLDVTHTGYPYVFDSDFIASDERLAGVVPLALHTLKMCSHETSMDCPHYEQLNYAGDTRLQSLVALTCAADDRLVRKNICLFDWSRTGENWTSSRYPTHTLQTIPPFALWWVAMVHDYALYRGDRAFVRQAMPGVRAVLDRWRQQIDGDGLVRTPAGWNFVDWVAGWRSGTPTTAFDTPCGVLQWQLSYTLGLAATLEEMMNEPLLAQRNRNTAAMLAAVGERAFYDAQRKLLADDVGRSRFSEHAQVLALISGQLSASLRDGVLAAIVAPSVAPGTALAKTSIYFSHYTFEALAGSDRIDALVERLQPWFDHGRLGLTTLLEQPEPSRSDCHAWAAHPAYHFQASILGVRPAAFGFEKVRVTPRLGSLKWAEGTMIHPRGSIRSRFERVGSRLRGFVTLPDGVTGIYAAGGVEEKLTSGRNVIG